MAATDAGADDVQPRKGGKKGWEVIADASAFGAVQSALREAGFKVSGEDSGLRLVPLAEVDVVREMSPGNGTTLCDVASLPPACRWRVLVACPAERSGSAFFSAAWRLFFAPLSLRRMYPALLRGSALTALFTPLFEPHSNTPASRFEQPSDEHYEGNEEMIDRLLDLDDVDSVYCNMKFDEDDE